jgi:hypothetical protein
VLCCAGLGWAGLGWAVLGWAGLGWAGLVPHKTWWSSLTHIHAVEPSPFMTQLGMRLEVGRRFAHPR